MSRPPPIPASAVSGLQSSRTVEWAAVSALASPHLPPMLALPAAAATALLKRSPDRSRHVPVPAAVALRSAVEAAGIEPAPVAAPVWAARRLGLLGDRQCRVGVTDWVRSTGSSSTTTPDSWDRGTHGSPGHPAVASQAQKLSGFQPPIKYPRMRPMIRSPSWRAAELAYLSPGSVRRFFGPELRLLLGDVVPRDEPCTRSSDALKDLLGRDGNYARVFALNDAASSGVRECSTLRHFEDE
jgi:hypothetical protein